MADKLDSRSTASDDLSVSSTHDETRFDLRLRGQGARTRVVVIGGGYAGSKAAVKISRDFPEYEVVMIDSKDYFENTIAVLTCLTHVDIKSSVQAAMKVAIRHDRYLGANTRVIKEMVKEVTPTKVILDTETIYYDYLVLACGSSYRNSIKSPTATSDYRVQALSRDASDLARANEILIVGGGLVGVELAGEIISQYPEKSVTMAHRGKRLLERMKPDVSAAALKWLTSKGVSVAFDENVRVSKKDPKKFRLPASQRYVTPDKVYWCTGSEPNSDLLKKHFPHAIGPTGYVKVNQFLQMEGSENIFVIGDLADLKEEKMAERAISHAYYVAKFLKQVQKKGTYKPYKPPKKPAMMVISLGPDYALLCTKRKLTAQGSMPASVKRWTFRTVMMKAAKKGHEGPAASRSPGSRLATVGLEFDENNRKVGFIGHYNMMTAELTSVLIQHGSEVHICSSFDIDINLADQLAKTNPTLIKSHRINPNAINTGLAALKGVQTVIFPYAPITPHDPMDLAKPYSDTLRTLAREGSLKHLILVHPGYLLEQAPLKGKMASRMRELEEAARNIDPAIKVTIVRYAPLFECFQMCAPDMQRTKAFRFPMPKSGYPFVAAEDVRDALVIIMARPQEFGNQVYSLGGDVNVPASEIADSLTRVAGHPIIAENVPASAMLTPLTKMTNAKIAPLWVDWYSNPKHMKGLTEDLETIINKPSITLEAWVQLHTHIFV